MTLTGDTGYSPGRGFNPARGTWRIPRSRGAIAGLLLMLLGAWGALVPFIGPALHFGFGGTATWAWTAARFWLEVLPACAAFLGGLMMLVSANRLTAMVGCWLAMAAGAWFIIGPTLARVWHLGSLGAPMGGPGRVAWTWLLSFFGLGALMLFLASSVAGRLSVRSLRDIQHAQMHHDLKRQARGGLFGAGAPEHERRPEPARVIEHRDEEQPRREEYRETYPSDTLRLRPTAEHRPTDIVTHAEEEPPKVQKVVTTTERAVYPSDTAKATKAKAGVAAHGGRHQAHEGLGQKLGQILVKHGHRH